ncbi:MAG: transposase zinc-binding domain-containing protein, partial [Desulfobacterales bacterium]|nr:transposase zinc-binding domain-containing protein [Desulfobacterales bacterium]
WCIMNCRTAIMGGHKQSCPDGHFHRIWYNSCKHRMCPLCAYLQAERWLIKQNVRILNCDHYHAIFTIPHKLKPLWRFNVALMTDILLRVSETRFFSFSKTISIGSSRIR